MAFCTTRFRIPQIAGVHARTGHTALLCGTLLLLIALCEGDRGLQLDTIREGLPGRKGLAFDLVESSNFTSADVSEEATAACGSCGKIFMLQDATAMRKAEAICQSDHEVFVASAADLGMSSSCEMQGSCKFMYKELAGIAGHFTEEQLRLLKRCLGDGILTEEDDMPVRKAEHERPLPGHMQRRRLNAGPALSPDTSAVEGPNYNPTLLAVGAQLQVDSYDLSTGGLQHSYFQTSIVDGNAVSTYRESLKVQQLHIAQWNLDRIDQQDMPLDRQYGFGSLNSSGVGSNVTLYVLDSGLRLTHQEFQSWIGGSNRAYYGYNFVDDNTDASDCDGHGTHVSSTAVGRLVGLAKDAKVVAVKVLNCQGSGTVGAVVAGLDWIAQNALPPAIATMSLGIPEGQWSQSLNNAVTSLIENYNVTVVVAAGNSKADSCTIAPANVPDAITVAATDLTYKFSPNYADNIDCLYSYSNTGSCISLFAPGVDIYAACGGASRCTVLNDTAYTWASGTSMAVPHVAGLAAMYLQSNPGAMPRQVKQAILRAATPGKLNLSDAGALPNTPNLLVNTLFGTNMLVGASEGPDSSGR